MNQGKKFQVVISGEAIGEIRDVFHILQRDVDKCKTKEEYKKLCKTIALETLFEHIDLK